MQKLNSLIIGAGKIAGELDSPDDGAVLTHAHVCQYKILKETKDRYE